MRASQGDAQQRRVRSCGAGRHARLRWLFLLSLFVRHERQCDLGGEIVHDDFGLRVARVDMKHAFEASVARPAGCFLIVHHEITNHAKRVPLDLETWTPALVDGSGSEFVPNASS